MTKFSFAFRTPFTKEKVIIEATDYRSARKQFAERIVNKRLPIKVFIDYVLILDENDNYVERVK